MAGDQIDAAFAAFAAITGLKSPWLRKHSTGVAELAEAAAWRAGYRLTPSRYCAAPRSRTISAGSACSNAIWEKPGPLGFGDWERVRLHPHYTERAFAQSTALA